MKTIRIVLQLLAVLAASPLQAAEELLIVYQQERSYYQPVIDSLLQRWPGKAFQLQDLESEQLNDNQIRISFGAKAARWLHQQTPSPAGQLSAFVTLSDLEQQAWTDKQAVLLLDQPKQRYLRLAQLLTPEKPLLIPLLSSQFDDMRLPARNTFNYRTLPIEEADDLIRQLRQELNRRDVLLALPDAGIFRGNLFKSTLLTSYRKQVPLLSFSESHVTAGALAAVYSDIDDIAADLLAWLADTARSNELIYPQHFHIAINKKVARSLRIDAPSTDELKMRLTQETAP